VDQSDLREQFGEPYDLVPCSFQDSEWILATLLTPWIVSTLSLLALHYWAP